MPSRIIALPFLVMIAICTFLVMKTDLFGYMNYALPPFFALAIIYILQPQIDWYYYKRNPPEMDEQIKRLLIKYSTFYEGLSLENKKRFRDRVCLYSMANEFIPKGIEEIPSDLKAIVAASVVQLTFGREDFLLNKFERVILYLQAFPSPQFPETFHASEIFEEDGVMLFSVEHLNLGFKNPKQYFNVGLHEYAKVFLQSYPLLDYPDLAATHWEELEKISGFSKATIEKFMGLETDELLAVSINYFHSFPQAFKTQLPALFAQYSSIFNLDPTQRKNPILTPTPSLPK